jgi:hypothetical protein
MIEQELVMRGARPEVGKISSNFGMTKIMIIDTIRRRCR